MLHEERSSELVTTVNTSSSPSRRALGALLLLSCSRFDTTLVGDDPQTEGDGDASSLPLTTPRLRFEPIPLPGVEDATDFAFLPGTDDELLVLSLTGGVHHLRLDGGGARALGTAQIAIFRDEGCGLHSLVVDPQFTDNGFVYTTRCVDLRESSLTRHVFKPGAVLEAGEVEILRVTLDRDPPEYWHRFGSFGFEPDGRTLWVLLGDHFVRENAQDPTTPFGSLLRIVPNRTPEGSGHTAAPGNAFDAGTGDPRVYAYGLRSPWRGTRDRQGRFFIGDVGEYGREEVNLVSAAGQNFGWPRYEGACTEDCEGLTNPLTSYGRSSEEPYVFDDPDTIPQTRRAVWVGDVYENPSAQRYYGLFDDRVIFGDFYTGWVRALRVDGEGQRVEDLPVGHLASISAWHTGPDGYMYALTLDGTLHRAVQVAAQ